MPSSETTSVEDFYPRPLRGGRPFAEAILSESIRISIHALCEEGDLNFCPECGRQLKFLSTPSARRATMQTAIPAAD